MLLDLTVDSMFSKTPMISGCLCRLYLRKQSKYTASQYSRAFQAHSFLVTGLSLPFLHIFSCPEKLH